MDLTIIVPCLNEIKILEDSIKRIKEVLDISKYRYEIIIIDDGSTDGTKELAKKIADKYNNIKFINHEKNKGRGITVDEGVRNARGKIAGYIDVDLETPASYILALVLEIEKGADIATAYRHYKFNLPYTHRWFLSKGYNFLVRLLLNVKLKDTETGCKFFNKKKITSSNNYTTNDLAELERNYLSTLSELGKTAATSLLIRGLANLQTFYLHQPDKAIGL